MRSTTLKGILVAAGLVLAASSVAETGIAGSETTPDQDGAHRVIIRIVIGSTSMTATLEDNPTARDFASLLPLTVTLREFSPAEKVSGALPRRLLPIGVDADTDLTSVPTFD